MKKAQPKEPAPQPKFYNPSRPTCLLTQKSLQGLYDDLKKAKGTIKELTAQLNTERTKHEAPENVSEVIGAMRNQIQFL